MRFNLSNTAHYICRNNEESLLCDVYFPGLQNHFTNSYLKINGEVDVLGICFKPDANDLLHSKKFGNRIQEMLLNLSSVNQITDLQVPGEKPYGGVTELWHIDFIEVNSNCTQCGICAEGCPVGAIDPDNTEIIDNDKCTLCCACIKHCPQNAKSIKPGLMKDAAIRCTKFTDRKEPELFLSY